MRAAMLAVGAPAKMRRDDAGAVRRRGDAAVRARHRRRARAREQGGGELAHDESVIGILAATDRKAAATSLAAASENGVPTLALDDAPPGATSTAFQLIHAPEARVAALARAALKLGARDFAMLGPDSAAGKRLREAFRREVTAAGGRITGDASYAPGATSFGDGGRRDQEDAAAGGVRRRRRGSPGADRARARGGRPVAGALGRAPPGGGARPAAPAHVLLLSTAAELSPRLLQNAGPLRPGRAAGARLLCRRRRRARARLRRGLPRGLRFGSARDRGLRLRRRQRVPRRDRGGRAHARRRAERARRRDVRRPDRQPALRPRSRPRRSRRASTSSRATTSSLFPEGSDALAPRSGGEG